MNHIVKENVIKNLCERERERFDTREYTIFYLINKRRMHIVFNKPPCIGLNPSV